MSKFDEVYFNIHRLLLVKFVSVWEVIVKLCQHLDLRSPASGCLDDVCPGGGLVEAVDWPT